MNVLFEFSNAPFNNDLASQYARMALAISMENKITLLYRDKAEILASEPFDIAISESNYFDQERFLIELEIDIYLLKDNKLTTYRKIKNEVKLIGYDDMLELYKDQDVIFKN